LAPLQLSGHDQEKKSTRRRLRVSSFFHDGLDVDNHFISIPLRFINDPVMTGRIGELSNDKFFDDASDVSGTSFGWPRAGKQPQEGSE
jgi:hypothetical protein